MTATFSNPRLAAIPCERMRSCSFAEDFVSELTVAENKGAFTGSGYAVDRGLTVTALDYVTFDGVVCASDFSVVVRFKTTTKATAVIFAEGLAGTGFTVGTVSDGDLTCIVNDGSAHETTFTPGTDYNDGEWHTITYVCDKSNSLVKVYYDSEAVVSEATTASGSTGGGGVIVGYLFTGEIKTARIFDAVLTEAEHDLYHAETLIDFLEMPLAVMRCDSINDDTNGNKILDRTTNLNHVTKGDGAGTGEPTFTTDHYVFDGVDDYISDVVTLPTLHTITAAVSTGATFPSVHQHNDDTFLSTLETVGGYTGNLHSLLLYNKVLSQIELYHDKYQQLSRLDRGRAKGAYHRLITEGVCRLAVFFDDGADWLEDLSPSLRTGSNTDAVHLSGTGGATFGELGAELLVDGDMEAATTAAYTVSSGAVLSKETTTPHSGSKCLRVKTLSGDNGSAAYQNILTIGKTYRVVDWYRTDGSGAARVAAGTTSLNFSATTEWTEINTEMVCAGTANFYLWVIYTPADMDAYSEFDDASVREVLAPGSNVEFADDAELELETGGTISVYGDFSTSDYWGTLVDKGTNYKLATRGNLIDFNGSVIAHTFNNNELIAVTFEDGKKPRFYVDWVFIGEGDAAITLDAADTNDVTIGNSNEYNNATPYALKHVSIQSKPLTGSEIAALYEQSRIINAS